MALEKSIDLELSRFFLALHKATEKPQLLPYLKKQIFDDTEKYYQELSDQEVNNWLKNIGQK
jgi:hypothetical protein